MPQLLLEFFSEEIPARMQRRAGENLSTLFSQQAEKYGLTFSTLKTYVSARRLVVVAEDVPAQQKEVHEERRGPRVDAPESAIQGFLTTLGLTLADCEERATPKGKFLFANLTKPAQDTVTILPDFVQSLLKNFPWPKSMRWEENNNIWVRPLHFILCLFDNAAIDLRLGIPSRAATLGHRFMAPHSIMAENFAAYKAGLEQAYVMVDATERQNKIEAMLQDYGKKQSLQIVQDQELVEEVTGLVEWPYLLAGKIDQQYMSLPEEVLITVMRNHQRYFAVRTLEGALAPYFLFITNIVPADQGKTIIRGNEWVLRARLADAQFFWKEDLKHPLAGHGEKLSRLIFHAQLGTLHQKVARLEALSVILASQLYPELKEDQVRRAARLCKADLTTNLVREFPELQGYVGAQLAHHGHEEQAITKAIQEHYTPQGSESAVPQMPLSIVLALADKIDTLSGFFLINERPTGSKDPYALRRAALGIIRLCLENNLTSFFLPKVFLSSLHLYREVLPHASVEKTLPLLLSFLSERLKVYLKEQGLRYDIVEASLDLDRSLNWIQTQATALQAFMELPEAQTLTLAYKRACNILRIELEKEPSLKLDLVPTLLTEKEEKALWHHIVALKPRLAQETDQPVPNFQKIFLTLSELGPALSDFFTHVTVNASEAPKRLNRLALLAEVKQLFEEILDFSKLEG